MRASLTTRASLRASVATRAGSLLVAALLLSGCNERNLDMNLFATSPLAVGARGLVIPKDACTNTGGKLGLECTKEVPRVVSYELEPAGILEVESEIEGEFSAGLVVRAVAEGTVSVTMVAENGVRIQTLTADVRAVTADGLELVPVAYAFDADANAWAAADLPCEAPYLFESDSKVLFRYQLLAGTEVLGADDFCPFSSDALDTEIECGATAAGLLSIRARAATGEGTLRSSVDPAWSIPVRVFDQSEVDGLALTESFGLVRREHLWAMALVGGRAACTDTLAREIAPAVEGPCQILHRMSPDPELRWRGPGPYEIYRLGSAPCVVDAGLEGTDFTAQAEYPR